ncbi:protein of unknown function [Lactobacillus delbrueckii subsp. delbrueckii]|uniref:LysR substrate-binding domain-containing protein n=1 Tax=Lactobacillus delbrueckii subsp. delbrueckii TaxID=83684 RepID=A0AAU9R886_9LACO|nr:protein of unknown function [Lactobacillus delbrueckii subsp. delbrueckii]
MPLLKRIRSPSQPSAPWSKGWKVQLVFTKSSRAPLVITPAGQVLTTPLQRYQYVLVVAEDSPLAQLDEIRIAQIKDTPLIMRHKRFLSRTSLDRLFAARNGRQLLDGYCRGKRSRRQSHPLGSKPAKLLLLQLGDPREFHSE